MLLKKTALVLALMGSATTAMANEPVIFGTNWLAQAEHGGYYQAVADGTYAKCGLDVTIMPGGPQVNNRALLLAGKIHFNMGGNMLEAFSAVQENVPVVVVAASFQKEPQVILTHPGAAATFADVAKLPTILIGDQGYASFYQWMIKAYGFTEEQRKPYTFNPAPFIADTGSAMQGYISSEPMMVEKEGGFKPDEFLLADQGWSTYATTIETMADTIATKPEQVQCFVDGSAIGWYNYLYGDNAAANAMIKTDNPDMNDEQIAFGIAKMIEVGIVDSGDSLTMGIGAITEAKVQDFFDKMVEAGVVDGAIDWKASFTTAFVNKGVGLDLFPK
jgi:NitT/TauT family transport system substrate-binding protein